MDGNYTSLQYKDLRSLDESFNAHNEPSVTLYSSSDSITLKSNINKRIFI
jgi:hypothetical protein